MKRCNNYFILALLVIFSSCQREVIDLQNPDSDIQGQTPGSRNQFSDNISIPADFNFETERAVTARIYDRTPNVKYSIYGFSSAIGLEDESIADALNNLIYTGRPNNGVINLTFSLSNIYDKVYISRKEGINYEYKIRDVVNNTVTYTSPYEDRPKSKSSNSNNESRTLCGGGGCDAIWTNGSFEEGPVLPASPSPGFVQSDQDNVNGWSTTATDGLIEIWASGFTDSGLPPVISQSGDYHAEINATQDAALYQRICTTPNAVLEWSIWHRGRAGVDVARVRIGSDLSTADQVAIMETDNDAWVQYSGTYTVPAGQDDTFLIFESVSTAATGQFSISVGNFIDNVEITETNPGDACECEGGRVFYPGGLNQANIAFEDLWPSQGDYDFNDLVISYRIAFCLDMNDNIEKMEYIYSVTNIGASYENGFGIEFPFAANLYTVTGQRDGASGGEPSENGSVIRFFDNASLYLDMPHTLTITFNDPYDPSQSTDDLPFNPFLTENGDTDYEVHLAGELYTGTTQPTTVPGFAPWFAQDNHDLDGDYKVDAGVSLDIPPVTDMENMPWAINISGTFVPPLPGAFIMKGHLKFREWAQSGGTLEQNWFQDLPGNRDNTYLDN